MKQGGTSLLKPMFTFPFIYELLFLYTKTQPGLDNLESWMWWKEELTIQWQGIKCHCESSSDKSTAGSSWCDTTEQGKKGLAEYGPDAWMEMFIGRWAKPQGCWIHFSPSNWPGLEETFDLPHFSKMNFTGPFYTALIILWDQCKCVTSSNFPPSLYLSPPTIFLCALIILLKFYLTGFPKYYSHELCS